MANDIMLLESDLQLSAFEQYTGHAIDKHVRHKHTKARIIYKRNKHNKAINSQYELAFSELATIFMQPHLTAKQELVGLESGEITGITAEYFGYTIDRAFPNQPAFIELSEIPQQLQHKIVHPQQPEQIPFHFFNEYNHGFFAKLLLWCKKNNITIDYDSLASILTSAYTLEEDDLHKGNFGFFITKNNNQACLRFFKIDHDLMLNDSIMSYGNARFLNWHYNASAFKITRRDLEEFPHLHDSGNYYWPTKLSFWFRRCNRKVYVDKDDCAAFTDLNRNQNFITAKWNMFLQHTQIKLDDLATAIKSAFNTQTDLGHAQYLMIMNAVAARQAQLRANLLATPAFRQHLKTTASTAYAEILPHIDENDTPLHCTIRLGAYRYHETVRSFSAFINTPNLANHTPLDILLLQIKNTPAGPDADCWVITNNPYWIAQHLIQLRKYLERNSEIKNFEYLSAI